MKKLIIATIAAAAMLPMALPSHAAKCTKLSGQGTAITNELATLNATMAINEAATAKGLKTKGAPATKCKYEGIVSTCTAKQTACK